VKKSEAQQCESVLFVEKTKGNIRNSVKVVVHCEKLKCSSTIARRRSTLVRIRSNVKNNVMGMHSSAVNVLVLELHLKQCLGESLC